jgi:hypothetical protein
MDRASYYFSFAVFDVLYDFFFLSILLKTKQWCSLFLASAPKRGALME